MAKQEKLARHCKEKMVDELVERFKGKPNFLITTYMGSTVMDLEQLRSSLKKSSSDYFVVKNSILKVVFDKLDLKDEISKIDGGMGISLSGEDIIATCRTVVMFSRTHDKLKIKGAVIEGRSVPVEKVKMLAELPPKEVLLARVVGGIKSPITGFVNVLAAVIRKFVYAVDAIKTKMEADAPAPAAGENKPEEPKKEEQKTESPEAKAEGEAKSK